MEHLSNKTFKELKIGESASLSHTLTKKDIELFAVMSGDVNPAHLDTEYAKSDIFHKIVGHGMWTAALISTLLGTKLPGPGTIYLEQTLKFLRPVGIDDVITAQVTVVKKMVKKPIVWLECKCINQNGKEVVTGKAKVMAPTERVERDAIELPEIIFKNPHS